MRALKSILSLLVLMACACGSIATGEQSSSTKNFNVCCCVTNLNSTIGATSENDCKRPCKAADPANIKWELIDSLNTWDEYNNRFEANTKTCKEFAGLQ